MNSTNSGEQSPIAVHSGDESPVVTALVQHWSGFVEIDHVQQQSLSVDADKFDQPRYVKKKKQ